MPLDESEIGPYRRQRPRRHRRRPAAADGCRMTKASASFAQPSGLASDGEWLFVADSEGSSIRAVPFDPLRTREHGRRHGASARRPAVHLRRRRRHAATTSALQHPLGVAYRRRQALRRRHLQQQDQGGRSPRRATTTTLAGTGKPGTADDAGAVRRTGRHVARRQESCTSPTRTIT